MKYFYDSLPLCAQVSVFLVRGLFLGFLVGFCCCCFKLNDTALFCASFDLMPITCCG